MAKALHIDYQKCTGCRTCELVCAVQHDGCSNPVRSRIKVMKWESQGLYIPMSCQQCQDAPCLNICPVKAISKDDHTGTVMVDYDNCIGCRSCVAVCPFGAMNYSSIDKRVFKCDLCDGEPQCVRFCDVKAVDFIEADEISILKKRTAAQKLFNTRQVAAPPE